MDAVSFLGHTRASKQAGSVVQQKAAEVVQQAQQQVPSFSQPTVAAAKQEVRAIAAATKKVSSSQSESLRRQLVAAIAGSNPAFREQAEKADQLNFSTKLVLERHVQSRKVSALVGAMKNGMSARDAARSYAEQAASSTLSKAGSGGGSSIFAVSTVPNTPAGDLLSSASTQETLTTSSTPSEFMGGAGATPAGVPATSSAVAPSPYSTTSSSIPVSAGGDDDDLFYSTALPGAAGAGGEPASLPAPMFSGVAPLAPPLSAAAEATRVPLPPSPSAVKPKATRKPRAKKALLLEPPSPLAGQPGAEGKKRKAEGQPLPAESKIRKMVVNQYLPEPAFSLGQK